MLTSLVLVASLLSAAKPAAAFQPKARPYDALNYRLEVKLDGTEGGFTNTLTLTLKAKKALTEIELDAYNLTIAQVTVDGAQATFTQKAEPSLRTGLLTVKAPKPIAAGKDAVVVIAYSGKAGVAHTGLFRVPNPDDEAGLPYFFTHFEASAAQTFFPCNDQPDDKATTELFAVVDGRYTVLSNGRKEKDETFTEGGNNLRRVQWVQDIPHSTYLVALAIGEFEAVPVGGDLPANLWVLPGRKERAFVAVDVTRAALSSEAAFVGVKYPWSKFDQVALPQFFWGGMENTSLVFNRESSFLLDTRTDFKTRGRIVGLITHELAHQWFGNLVTLKWWDDTWLNEGFATYLGDVAEDAYWDNDLVEIETAESIAHQYFRAEDGPLAHPLVGKLAVTPDDVFDEVSYAKGAAVLRMLELWVGRADFKLALKAYLEKFARQNATSDDFFASVFAATKKEKELKPFKEAWLKKKGYPVLFPDAVYADGKLTVTIRQQPNHADEKGPFVFKLPIVVHRDNEPKYSREELITIDKPEVKVVLDVQAPPQWINWNKNQGALARINTPSVSEEQWVDAARYDPDPVWRATAAWVLLGEYANPNLVKEDQRPTDGAFNAVRDVLTKDPSPAVRASVLRLLAKTRWKKLPREFGATVLGLAKRPTELTDDAYGRIVVQNAALTLLGKLDFPEGHKYLLDELAKRDLDLNYLGAFASGAARIGTPGALGTLRAAINTQKARGMVWYRAAVKALPQVESAEVLPVLKEALLANAANTELARSLLRVEDNFVLQASPAFPPFIQAVVLDEGLALDVRARALEVLGELKTPETKAALTAVVASSPSDRLKGLARQILEGNFPAAPAPKGAGKKP